MFTCLTLHVITRAVRVGSRMLTDDVLLFLMDNANHRYTTDSEVSSLSASICVRALTSTIVRSHRTHSVCGSLQVCMHALLALEKFSKTGPDNARRISEVTIPPRFRTTRSC